MSSNQNSKIDFNALYDTDREFIRKVLQYKLNVPLYQKNDNNDTILHKMIAVNDYKSIELLLENIKANIYDNETKNILLNTQNNNRNAPIHLAVQNGQQDIAKKLHNCGANLTLINGDDMMVRASDSDIRPDSRPVNKSDKSDAESDVSIRNILKNLIVSNQPPVNHRLDTMYDLSTISSSDKQNDIYPNNFIRQNSSTLPTQASEQSQTVSTIDFMNFLKNKIGQNGQIGGANVLMGTRKVKSTHAEETSDSLGIHSILAEQQGGRKHKVPKKRGESKTREEPKKRGESKTRRKSTKRYSSKLSSKSSRSTSSKSASRPVKPSSDIHAEVIEIIKKMGHTEDDARYIKAGLYQMVKDKFANLSNMQRSLKLKELTTVEEVNKVVKQLPKLKELVMKAREQRTKESVESKDSKEKKPKNSKEQKPKESKELKEQKTKEPKKAKA